ncbi:MULTISPECIES: methylated-DNA--[protein]-cysteine S-methyltransferase [unclassified Stenotrophomonas]|uniref:methylated-DNA--[protein]-cysteine S-methyltransferase n=1 Tax=unclassified Stenotrophomonas TaxID=196198 RepID=UPI0024B5C618|nr:MULTISPECIES: methylated-DNA--[protein]-cysteine S-methyltransferase [unclassified Stenotrophomonas]MDI9248323.1 methylated-DNA--[protein]-cysteine S-methyltransferase [Stenotrophomonas sp. RS-48]MDI9271813.1 methylated-DNA--[protein]-cysteine S-methyltransferase [Stenotrophomonas sp. PFBMAA-4]
MNIDQSFFKYNFRAPGSEQTGTIRYAVGETTRGKALIGRSERGICAIFLGSNDGDLVAQLKEAFPHLPLVKAQSELYRELGQVIAFIDKDSADGIVDLDVGGSAFQQKVWQTLCGIPMGETRSYSDVAEHLGVPEAVRAVASACAANVLALAIPCHRVVRKDGALAGYRWGIERKRNLLADEAAS